MRKMGIILAVGLAFLALVLGGFRLRQPVQKQADLALAQPKFSEKVLKQGRTFLLSDIHGRFDSFKQALISVKFDRKDQLYVLGDTIDRGPSGFHALLYLTKTLPAEGYHVTVLTGNHEKMWQPLASNGATDAAQLANLKASLLQYQDSSGNLPNGWSASLAEWTKLSAAERQFLLRS